MSPTLTGGRDYVVVWPAKEFMGDALYVIEDDAGRPTIWQGQRVPKGIRLSVHNPAYCASSYIVPREWFDGHVLGVVMADLRMRHMGTIGRHTRSGQAS